jgi:DnaA family protein
MTLGPEVAGYVLRRAPRATPDLLAVLERLDVAAMAGKRRLSVALAREVLDAMPP